MKKKIIEGPGDLAGARSFQGGPFGYGNTLQLALYEPDPDLFDTTDDEYQKQYHEKRQELEDAKKAQFREDLGRILYRDLPGFPPTNTLEDQQKFVPSNEETRTPSILDPEQNEERNTNSYNSTRNEDRGMVDIKINDLVKPENFLDQLPEPSGEKKQVINIEDLEDVEHAGSMGKVISPQKNVPRDLPNSNKYTLESFVAEITNEIMLEMKNDKVLQEKAPPGMEDVVMSLKDKYGHDSDKPFKIAWSIYNKKHKKKK